MAVTPNPDLINWLQEQIAEVVSGSSAPDSPHNPAPAADIVLADIERAAVQQVINVEENSGHLTGRVPGSTPNVANIPRYATGGVVPQPPTIDMSNTGDSIPTPEPYTGDMEIRDQNGGVIHTTRDVQITNGWSIEATEVGVRREGGSIEATGNLTADIQRAGVFLGAVYELPDTADSGDLVYLTTNNLLYVYEYYENFSGWNLVPHAEIDTGVLEPAPPKKKRGGRIVIIVKEDK